MIESDFNITLWILLGIFAAGSVVLAVDTTVKVIRLRNIRMSWKAGNLRGYPLFSTIFLFVTLVVLGLALYREQQNEILLASSYLVLGLSWFATSYLTAKRYITDHGIVKNINELVQTVAWHQIRDLVEKEGENATRFIFIYVNDENADFPDLVRLELNVPERLVPSFRRLISHKLGRRISCYNRELFRIEQFD